MQLTVFTPTYNRRELLKRTYDSLCRQTCKDFEWLIVDDGSSDDTESLVNEWIEEDKITIRYKYRENGGKMRAHNTGVELAAAELFLCVDSDDFLVDTAVEELLNCYNSYAGKNIDGIPVGGVVAHKGKSETELLGSSEFPIEEPSTLYGLYLKGFSGETTLMYETALLRRFPFPEIDGEKYVPEDYIYDKIDGVCVLAVLPRIITVCEIVEEGYTDSVSRLKKENPMAWYLYYEQRSEITPTGVLRCKYLGRYVIYARRVGRSVLRNKKIGFFSKIAGFAMAFVLTIIRKE